MWLLWSLLGVFFWAVVNVLDSVLVHRFTKHPFALMWSQSFVSIPILIVLAFFLPLDIPWIPLLFLFGMTSYAGDVWFFVTLKHVDVSVSNIAWSLLSLLLALSGVLFFHETWGLFQFFGAILIISGVLFLSCFHHTKQIRKTIGFVAMLALLYLPFYIVKKFAIDHGIQPASVFFWMLAGRELTSFSLPWFFPTIRRVAFAAFRESSNFFIVNFFVILSFFLAEYFGALAYQSGDLSLVAITANLQAFVVIALAWVLVKVFPHSPAKELLTTQSVIVKVISFSLVFIGLALLAIP